MTSVIYIPIIHIRRVLQSARCLISSVKHCELKRFSIIEYYFAAIKQIVIISFPGLSDVCLSEAVCCLDDVDGLLTYRL